ncbi:MAG: DUF6544 family protein [Gammaproteobacteria bacterium]
MIALGVLLLLVTIAGVLIAVGRFRYRRSRRAHRRTFNALAVPDISGTRTDMRQLALLPEPAARYLRHALPADGHLARTVDLYLVGRIRPQPQAEWIGFEAHERICPGRGFISEARLQGLGPFSVEGADYLLGEDAGSEYFLGGLLGLVKISDQDLRRSAEGRLLLASIWLPCSLLPESGARWRPGDATHATAVVPAADSSAALNFTIRDSGMLAEVAMMRHVDPTQSAQTMGPARRSPFSIVAESESCWDGFTIPSRFTASWDHGTETPFPFLQARLESARFF